MHHEFDGISMDSGAALTAETSDEDSNALLHTGDWFSHSPLSRRTTVRRRLVGATLIAVLVGITISYRKPSAIARPLPDERIRRSRMAEVLVSAATQLVENRSSKANSNISNLEATNLVNHSAPKSSSNSAEKAELVEDSSSKSSSNSTNAQKDVRSSSRNSTKNRTAATDLAPNSEVKTGSNSREIKDPWKSVRVNSSAPLSFFCFSVLFVGKYSVEEQLITRQWEKKWSIFACHGWAVIAQEKKRIGGEGAKGFDTIHLKDGMHDKKGQVGVACSETPGYLNAWTFMNVWALLMRREDFWTHDFTVKVDPDAVFFPYRLTGHVQQFRERPIILTTCPGNKLWGSLEVISRGALKMYAEDMDFGAIDPHEPRCPEKCKALPWWCWGEDMYIQRCMETLGVQSQFDPGLIQQGCNPGTCSDQRVAFHKYGEVWRYNQCEATANR